MSRPALILGLGAGRGNLHMHSVLLDTLADGAVAGAGIALTHRFYWLDPVLAAVIAALIGVAAISLLVDGIEELRARSAAG
jgi:Co/Zn/Cd efflux system component